MLTKRFAGLTLATVGLAAIMLAGSHAASALTVINGNFESPVAPSDPGYTTGGHIDGWTDPTSSAGTYYYGVQNIAGLATSDPDGGSQFLYINVNPSNSNVYQNVVSGPLAAGTQYTLNVDVLHRFDAGNTGSGTIGLYSSNLDGSPGTLLSESSVTTPASLGNFTTLTDTYTVTGSVSGLDIVLYVPPASASQYDFDNVRLTADASAAPEPSAWASLAIVGVALAAMLSGARRRNAMHSKVCM